MHIKITTSIKNEEFVKIIEFYNKYKPVDAEPLEQINSTEGGFKINAKKAIPHNDPNNNIRQLRWYNQRLIQHQQYNQLTIEEQDLLYKSLKTVLGKDAVLWE